MAQFRFPETRSGLTSKIECGLDVYITVNAMPDGEPAEIFVKLGKQGTAISGLKDAWVVTISAALQRGIPWSELRDKYPDSRFEPSTHEYASLVDAVSRTVEEMAAEMWRAVGR